MSLVDLNIGDRAVVKKLHATSTLKHRFLSFGMIKGADVRVLAVAPAKNTIEIEVGKMKIALRKEEAKTVEVERI